MSIIDDYYKSNTSNKENPILLNNIYNHKFNNINIIINWFKYKIYCKLINVDNKNIYEIMEEISKFTY